MKIDFLGLEAFVAVAERGGFQRAAAHLNLTQTALSHRLRKLEEQVGTTLLARTSRRVSLTPAGLALLPAARRAIEDLGAALDQTRAAARAAEARLAVGCLPTLAERFMPPVLAAFARGHPDVTVRLFDNAAAEIATRVQTGDAAFALTILGAGRFDLAARPLLTEPFVLVAPAGHPMTRRDSVTWAELAGAPLVRVSSETGNRLIIDDALGTRGETLAWRWEVQRLSTALALVEAGGALAVVPRLAVDRGARRGLVAIPLEGPRITRTLGILTRIGVPLTRAASDMVALIEQALADEGDAAPIDEPESWIAPN